MEDAPEDPSYGPLMKDWNDLPRLKPEVRSAGGGNRSL